MRSLQDGKNGWNLVYSEVDRLFPWQDMFKHVDPVKPEYMGYWKLWGALMKSLMQV